MFPIHGHHFGNVNKKNSFMQIIKNPTDAFNSIYPLYKEADNSVEHCAIMLLNSINRVVYKEIVTTGDEKQCIIPLKNIAKKALLNLASGVILVHNHPSGDPTPGTSDIRQTEKLSKILDICDVSLTDHIIIGDDSFYSFKKEQKIKIDIK